MKKIFVALLLVTLSAALTGCGTQGDPGHVGVVRNGGPIDNHKIKGSPVCPGQGYTWIGIASTTHEYPDRFSQRIYTITSDRTRGDRAGVDVVHVPTSDGIQVGVEATIYLKTAFDCKGKGAKLVKDFDEHFGVRTFPIPHGDPKAPWDTDEGWSAFLDAVVRPVIDNNLREEIGNFECAQLQSSCALVKNTGAPAPPVTGQNNKNIAAIQSAIGASLSKDLTDTLGGEYFTGVQIKLQRITLPGNIQNAISDAQASYAALSKAKSQVTKAQLENDANAAKAALYQKYPALAQIEMMKSVPAGANVYFGVTPVLTASAGGR